MQRPANQPGVRRHDLGIVLGHVVRHGAGTRATIAQETGLNTSTVSSLVTELIGLGLLRERGSERTGSAGRPGLVVAVAAGIGLEVNVDDPAVLAGERSG